MSRRAFSDDYEDIIHLPHHISANRSRMSVSDRAAQFSPFAALTGHNEAVMETQRLTEEKRELDENQKVIINEKLQMVAEKISEHPDIIITYFEPDSKKSGGACRQLCGKVKKIDEIENCIWMMDGTRILMNDIYDISFYTTID